MTFEMSYTPRYDELIAAERAAIRMQFPSVVQFANWSNFCIYFALVATLISFGGRAFAALQPMLGQRRSVSLIIAGTIALVLFAELASRVLQKAWLVRTLKRRNPNSALNVTLSEEGISWFSSDSGTWVNWIAIEKVLLLPSVLVLIAGGFVYSVPTRIFSSTDEMKRFFQEIWRRVPETARNGSLSSKALNAMLN